MYKSLYIILFLFAASGVQAQQLPERSLVRKGNRQYAKGNYEESIRRYEQALEAVCQNLARQMAADGAPMQRQIVPPPGLSPPFDLLSPCPSFHGTSPLAIPPSTIPLCRRPCPDPAHHGHWSGRHRQ